MRYNQPEGVEPGRGPYCFHFLSFCSSPEPALHSIGPLANLVTERPPKRGEQKGKDQEEAAAPLFSPCGFKEVAISPLLLPLFLPAVRYGTVTTKAACVPSSRQGQIARRRRRRRRPARFHVLWLGGKGISCERERGRGTSDDLRALETTLDPFWSPSSPGRRLCTRVCCGFGTVWRRRGGDEGGGGRGKVLRFAFSSLRT